MLTLSNNKNVKRLSDGKSTLIIVSILVVAIAAITIWRSVS